MNVKFTKTFPSPCPPMILIVMSDPVKPAPSELVTESWQEAAEKLNVECNEDCREQGEPWCAQGREQRHTSDHEDASCVHASISFCAKVP